MLSGKDKALLVKLFYMKEESATVPLRKFRLQKNVKTRKGPLNVAELLIFETQCTVGTVNAQRYLTLLHEKVVPCLSGKYVLSTVTFTQDGATSHTANPVKEFLIQTFEEERIIRKRCRIPLPPRSLDLTQADFWLRGYLKSRMYRIRPFNLLELKEAIHRELSCIQSDILHSAVARFVTRLQCLIPYDGGHVEPILL
ncbi:uncharacterized protein NPIL_138241 [Nephila pilipes]|uniref:DUF4817 domain-containing protein n=1 Tax=Nephila pilipes TaxID=299642 RepID=A0A8X6NWF2_NEPPI|nr:uncharacterized protein NPIL_138241 [Nephila pilipes]